MMIKLLSIRTWILLCLSIMLIQFNSFAQTQKHPSLKNGSWLGVISRSDSNKIRFNINVEMIKGKTTLYILNADEKILVDEIRLVQDSIQITLPFFNASLIVKKEGNDKLNGYYIKGQGDKATRIAFQAFWGIKERFPKTAKANHNVSGSWDVQFISKNNAVSKAVGSFVQKPNGIVTGSFLTPTGDYRYLEGIVAGDTLKLSGFDGGFASFFQGVLKDDSTIIDGKYFSGAVATTAWTAQKNDHAELPDEYAYSHLREGESSLSFKFKDTDGKWVSILDDKYKNKVVIVQILGSWCPNCMDETAFLSKFYNENKQRGIEIIGLAYERYDTFEASKKALSVYQKRFNVQYPFLITGVSPSDPQKVEKTLPEIDKIAAFPSSIFIDKKGKVRKIHTGYDGPGTGKFFEAFKVEFNQLINELLSEK